MKASRGVYVIQIVLLLLLVCMLASAAMAQANLQGRWRTSLAVFPLIVPVIGCRETDRRDTCRGNTNLLPFATRHTEVHSAVVVGLGRRWNIKVR